MIAAMGWKSSIEIGFCARELGVALRQRGLECRQPRAQLPAVVVIRCQRPDQRAHVKMIEDNGGSETAVYD